jgi:hypothetical protein
MASMMKTSRRLGDGKYVVTFDGVKKTRSDRYDRDVLLWLFHNNEGIVEVVTGTNAADGTTAGDMLTAITNVAIGESADPDQYAGHEYACTIAQVGGRRLTTITSPSGASVTTGNGGAGGNGGFDVG